jgi:hypothetical protein
MPRGVKRMRERCLRRVNRTAPAAIVCAAIAVACGRAGGDPPAPATGVPGSGIPATSEGRDDPLACKGCHSDHYQSWSLSMHAYAADDPIFLAMNARGQRETGGALGNFCVRCHAPLAVARGATTNGLNLGELPAGLRGVTCIVCHTTSSAGGSFLDIADDDIMRGPLADPVASVHASVYSSWHDRQRLESASLCGACHAVTNGHGLEIERTIDEWRTTSFAQLATLRTCGRCHMPESIGFAANVAGAPLRPVHDHVMPGIDLGAASPAQRKRVQESLDPAISSRLCVVPGPDGVNVSATIENPRVGHAWPSGATHNRRAWLELVAYAGGAIAYASGVVGDDEAVTASASTPLVLLREQLYDDRGNSTLFMWSAQTAQSLLLAPASADPAHATQTATVQIGAPVDRVTARVRVRAIDRDVTDALIASGDLPPAAGSTVATLTVAATVMEWTSDRGAACLP